MKFRFVQKLVSLADKDKQFKLNLVAIQEQGEKCTDLFQKD